MPDRPLSLYRPHPVPAHHNGSPAASAPRPPAPVAPRASWQQSGPVEVDYDVVRSLQTLVSDRVSEHVRSRAVGADEQRNLTTEEALRVVREHIDNRIQAGEGDQILPGYQDALAQAVIAQLLGMGRLQPLLDDPEVKNIHVLGHDRVRVEYADGRIDESTYTAAGSDAELIELLQQRASRDGITERSLSTAQPVLHLRLAGGERLVAAIAVTPRPVVVIRRHRITKVTLDDLVTLGAITPVLAAFLRAAVAGNLNIFIAGLAGSGKTTTMRAIASEIPADEWFAVMETERELALDKSRHPWVVEFEERQGFGARDAHGRPEGELTLVDLFPDMLRMNMQRVVVGEVRGPEVISLFDAGSTTQGTLSTLHARSPDAALIRLANLLMRYGASSHPVSAYMQVAGAIDLLVFQRVERRRGQPDRHYISDVLEINGVAEGDQGVARSTLFKASRGQLAMPTGVRPSPHILDALEYGGFDLQTLLGGGPARPEQPSDKPWGW
ncbi:pilus assembly protein CpaF [Actinoplanes cyaneus]|uniref:Pilus assembly protein CpaF n=1 Tax=Actinoplanes cyaneus TaxID=52696 RepID=A0A919IV54_9ACTN|nr:ATPase, T2SS/T4P/T4SS family [Actinoplanes cyaneus]MCW2144316.1 Pilus assembly protein, ATPase of CpaF family [Actinoplanes cyaneus]GID71072.1 pilus assembly protein CpaF [Actinoplanes cyaneus]